jgi:hypothetical protein
MAVFKSSKEFDPIKTTSEPQDEPQDPQEKIIEYCLCLERL